MRTTPILLKLVKQDKKETSHMDIFKHLPAFRVAVSPVFPGHLSISCSALLPGSSTSWSLVLKFVFFLFKAAPERFTDGYFLRQAALPMRRA